MAEELPDACRAGLDEVRKLVEGLRFDPEQHDAHLHLPGALLARATFLTESALAVVERPERGVAGVVLRSALEAWIDCCYTVYGKEPAVLELLQSKLNNEKALAGRVLPGFEATRFAKEQSIIDEAVAACVERGSVPTGFRPTGKLNVHDRLLKAIDYAGSDAAFINVYHQAYRTLSTLEVHPAGAIDVHASEEEGEFRFSVTPADGAIGGSIIGYVTMLVLMAGSELARQFGVDAEPIAERSRALLAALQEHMKSTAATLLATVDPEVREALSILLRSAQGD